MLIIIILLCKAFVKKKRGNMHRELLCLLKNDNKYAATSSILYKIQKQKKNKTTKRACSQNDKNAFVHALVVVFMNLMIHRHFCTTLGSHNFYVYLYIFYKNCET